MCTRKCICTQKSEYVQGNKYVHKRVGTYTVREAHDQFDFEFERISRKNLVRFVFSKINRIDHGKEVCKLKFFLKGFEMILKSEEYSQEVLKMIRFKNR